jgi:membrane protease YdiL (CAAX protease family)
MFFDIFQIFIICILPIALWGTRIIKTKYRWWVFSVVTLITLLIVISQQWTLYRLGLRLDNLKISLIPYLTSTLLGLLAVFLLSKILHKNPLPRWWKYPHFLFGFVIFSVMQEFVYRGYLMPKLESLLSSVLLVIIFNAVLFMLVHIMFKEIVLAMSLSLAAGLMFAGVYYFYPNLILVSVSHMILNFFAVYYGFFLVPENEI